MKTYDIVALGPSGSGKTVFLASMYNELFVQDPSRTFYIKTDHSSGVRLNELYNQVARPGTEWPQASVAIREWTFTACVNSPFGNYPLSRFRYLDYPGEWLTSNIDREDFFAQLKKADALLGVLDGDRILALLRNEPAGDGFLNYHLHALLSLMQQSSAPIHFVITKWDLLQDRHSLAEVRDRLLATRPFRNLIEVRARAGGATVRLIPISAVGSGFAEPTKDGSMAKRRGTNPRPYNIDIPLASVVPDHLQHVIESLDETTRQLVETKVDAMADLSTGERALVQVGNALRAFAPAVHTALAWIDPKLAKRISDQDLYELARTIDRKARAKLETTERAQLAERERSLKAVRDERSALDHLHDSFAQALDRFEREHPDCLLTATPAVAGRS